MSPVHKEKKYQNGKWKLNQHKRFEKGLEKYGRKWLLVQKMVGTRSVEQVRSHAQKIFMKMSNQDIEDLYSSQFLKRKGDYENNLKKRKINNERKGETQIKNNQVEEGSLKKAEKLTQKLEQIHQINHKSSTDGSFPQKNIKSFENEIFPNKECLLTSQNSIFPSIIYSIYPDFLNGFYVYLPQ